MTITAAIVLFAVIWFMVLFVVLPLRLTTQGEAGEVVAGTHRSAPSDAQIGRKARLTTFWAIGLWVVIAGVIVFGGITVRDIDMFGRMAPAVTGAGPDAAPAVAPDAAPAPATAPDVAPATAPAIAPAPGAAADTGGY